MKKVTCYIVFLMLLIAPQKAFATEEPIIARPVTGSQVIRMLYKFHASTDAIRGFGEVSEAIAKAATEDPLFPHVEEGSEMTAAILVAVAWWESRFIPGAVGDSGRSFGLYQIQPPSAKVNSKVLTVASQASFVAIGLMRDSIRHCIAKGRDWREALAWYAASSEYGAKHPKIVAQSRHRMQTAAELFREFFAPKDSLGHLLSQKQPT